MKIKRIFKSKFNRIKNGFNRLFEKLRNHPEKNLYIYGFKIFFALALILIAITVLVSNLSPKQSERKSKSPNQLQEIKFPDISNWKKFQSNRYSFSINYPRDWQDPQQKIGQRNLHIYESVFEFRKNNFDDFQGFDIFIYAEKNLDALIEGGKLKNKATYKNIFNYHPQEFKPSNYTELSSIEVEIGSNDNCYEENYFGIFETKNYVFVITPVYVDGAVSAYQIKNDLFQNFPEYFASVQSFSEEKTKRATTARRYSNFKLPVAAIRVNGKLVCAKKNDKPSISQKTKGKLHLDLECCLDPDEIPNPHCTYDPNVLKKLGF